ncbi:MAG: hypothetical protein QM742_17415 [Aquabacterium sp.]
MPASAHLAEAALGIQSLIRVNDSITNRCAAGGAPAKHSTPNDHIPIVREWEYAQGKVIVFSMLDSCLGAVQIAGKDSVRGAHFSMLASSQVYDTVQFAKALANAGFTSNEPILYFGGMVNQWKTGMGHSVWLKQDNESLFKHLQTHDETQKCWIFEVENGKLTCEKF